MLWVGTNAGLARYRESQDRFEAVPLAGDGKEQAGIRALLVAGNGIVWVAGYDGLSRYDPGTGRREAWRFADEQLPADRRFETLASDGEGRVWLGSLGGLSRLDPASGRVDQPFGDSPDAAPLRTTRIDALLADRGDRLWIGAVGEGLFRLDVGRGDLRRYRHRAGDPTALNSDILRSLLRDRDGRLWIGTREGLNLMPAPDGDDASFRRFRHYRHDPRSLGAGRVMSLLQAADGSLLAGTYTGGVSVLNPRGNRFTSFTPDNAATAAMRDPVVYSLLRSGDDSLWLGGRNGLYRFHAGSGELEDFAELQRKGVSAMAADGSDLWLGELRGAQVMDTASGALRVPALPGELAGVQVISWWLEGEHLVAGTYDRGVHVLRRDTLALLALHPVDSWVSQFAAFDADTLLFCSSEGLHWLSRDGLRQRHRHRAGSDADADLPPGGVTYFLRARDGGLWLASVTAGLVRMTLGEPGNPASARFETFPQFKDLGLNIVQAIAEDASGKLWLSTSRGIGRFDPATGALARFGAADGAFDSDYQSAAVATLADGRLAFAATRGFTLFDPAQVLDATPPPAPVLTELRLWNRRVEPRPVNPASPLATPLHLARQLAIPAADAGMVSLRFSALDLAAPERLHYAYRLEGFDPDWIEAPASERSATYTNLAPGRYRFLVKAGEPGQLADAATTSLLLDILPPWWQTAWARALFALAALAALYGGLRWRVHAIDANRAHLRRLVSERTAELSQAKQGAEQALAELRDTQRGLIESEKMASLGSLVSGVAHEINTPLGVAVTASSMLSDRTLALQKQYSEGSLTPADLEAFLGVAREATVMVDRNLERTAQLVSSFKQVSIDHYSDERRRFALSDYLRTLLHSLEPNWKRRPVTFELDVEEGLNLDSYPGAIAQVVSNLVQNALVHAFAEDEPGTLRLSARAMDGERVELVVGDSGPGIPPEVLPHVFEPFYTTRRGRGGTGLGLHIVYNLVTARLGGTIDVQSTSAGTRMIVRFPKTAK